MLLHLPLYAAHTSYADADTIVSDPAVPIREFLPPPSLDPAPHLVFAQDHTLTTTSFALRISPLSLAFMTMSSRSQLPSPPTCESAKRTGSA